MQQLSPLPPDGVLEEVLAQALLEKVSCLSTVASFFTATLPLPPSVNGSYQPVVNSARLRIANTKDAKRYKQDATLLLSQSQHIDRDVLHALQISKKKIPIALELKFFYKTLWRRDLDNAEKIVTDVVFNYFISADGNRIINDNQIVDKHSAKYVDAQRPRVEVHLRCLVFPVSQKEA